MTNRSKISAFVISYNRENIIHTCLSGLQFVDELILVDKSSTDRTVEIASPLVDKVVVVPWTPTADDTRQFAETLCSHDWVLFLDDDECLNVDAIKFIEQELENPRALYYKFPLRHYICGIHSENAYYWPESHIRLYKKGAISFQYKIHDYIKKNSDNFYLIPSDAGPCIHHFSHKNIQEWIEKCNRYTSETRRFRMSDPGAGNNIINYAHRAIDRWVEKTKGTKEGGYEVTIAVLRATYDIIDRLKCWEEENFIDGNKLFEAECLALEGSYKNLFKVNVDDVKRMGYKEVLCAEPVIGKLAEVTINVDLEDKGVAAIRDKLAAQRESYKLLQRVLEDERQNHQNIYRILLDERNSNKDATLHLENQLKSAKLSNRELIAAYQGSYSWRITKPIRGVISVAKKIKVGVMQFYKRFVTRIANVFFVVARLISKEPNNIITFFYDNFPEIYENSLDFKNYARSQISNKLIKHSMGYISSEDVSSHIASIAFEPNSSPKVSIVIPIFGEPNLVLMLLNSIKKSESKVSYEIILINALETDESSILKGISGITYIATDKKLGFADACNLGIQNSKGEYIQLLHQDVRVERFWLDGLLKTFAEKVDCAAVGSMILDPRGRVEHAGGIIFEDGTVCNYGDGEDPQDERFAFLKPVDFCSSSSMLIKKSALELVSFLNSSYKVGKFETIDLAIRLRKLGFNIYYQPLSVVTHFSGASKISSLELSATNSYTKNELIFKRIWSGWIGENGKSKSTPRLFSSFNLAEGKKRILLVDHYIPQYDIDAGSRTIWNFLETLASSGYQMILWPQNMLDNVKYSSALHQMGVEVIAKNAKNINFSEWIREYKEGLDLIIISRPHVAEEFIPIIRKNTPTKIIYYGHDIHFQRMELEADAKNNSRHDQRILDVMELEKSIWKNSDLVLYPTIDEIQYIKNSHENINVSPVTAFSYKTFDKESHTSMKSRRNILYVAGFGHPPNVDGILWFVRSVWPLLHRIDNSLILNIVGSNPTAAIKGLASKNIVVHGYITDKELSIHYKNSRVSIAPLLSGGGIKGKIVEALTYGLPVVTTTIGARGFLEANKYLTVADTPNDFYSAVSKLLIDDEDWSARSRESVNYAMENFSKKSMLTSLEQSISLIVDKK